MMAKQLFKQFFSFLAQSLKQIFKDHLSKEAIKGVLNIFKEDILSFLRTEVLKTMKAAVVGLIRGVIIFKIKNWIMEKKIRPSVAKVVDAAEHLGVDPMFDYNSEDFCVINGLTDVYMDMDRRGKAAEIEDFDEIEYINWVIDPEKKVFEGTSFYGYPNIEKGESFSLKKAREQWAKEEKEAAERAAKDGHNTGIK